MILEFLPFNFVFCLAVEYLRFEKQNLDSKKMFQRQYQNAQMIFKNILIKVPSKIERICFT